MKYKMKDVKIALEFNDYFDEILEIAKTNHIRFNFGDRWHPHQCIVKGELEDYYIAHWCNSSFLHISIGIVDNCYANLFEFKKSANGNIKLIHNENGHLSEARFDKYKNDFLSHLPNATDTLRTEYKHIISVGK